MSGGCTVRDPHPQERAVLSEGFCPNCHSRLLPARLPRTAHSLVAGYCWQCDSEFHLWPKRILILAWST